MASGVEPSEHTSIMIATMMVIAKPVKVGRRYRLKIKDVYDSRPFFNFSFI